MGSVKYRTVTGPADKTFQHALAALQVGKTTDAERLFKKLLSTEPKHVAGLNLFGILLTNLGRFEEAENYLERAVNENAKSDASFYNYGIILKALKRPIEALERFNQALAINSSVAETWNNRGTVLNDLKRYSEAVDDFDKAISINPKYAEAYCNKGKSLAQLKLEGQSLGAFETAISLRPDLAEAWLGRSNIFLELKRYDDAFAACDKALALKSDLAEAWFGRGNIFVDLKRYDEALAAYDKALALKPDLAEVWLGRGNIFVELKRYGDASAAYDKALALKPDLAEVWLGRGDIFVELKRYDDASAAYDKALALKSGLAKAWLGRGNVFAELKRFDDALAAYDKALALNPGLAEVWLGRGNVFVELNQYDDACAAYDQAIELDPDMADAYWCKSLVKLSLGNFEEGWDLYEWRSQSKENILSYSQLKSLNTSLRQDRSALIGKKVAILGEQGIGDEIMFGSILPDLISDAKAIYYEVDPRLTHLFKNAFPSVNIIPNNIGHDYLKEHDIDVVLQAGSLGYAYRRNYESFPRMPYLSAEANLINNWKAKLAGETNSQLKIGISWRGGTDKTRRNERSIELEKLRPLIQEDDRFIVSLQYGNVNDEILRFNNSGSRGAVHCLLDDFNNFDDFAALVMALDLVISVQNTTIHMCGALGKTCWGIIPWRPEWRYGSRDSRMTWYSSVSLYRQETQADWDGAISLINSNLVDFVGDTND